MEEVIVGVVGVLQFDVLNTDFKTSTTVISLWKHSHMNLSVGL